MERDRSEAERAFVAAFGQAVANRRLALEMKQSELAARADVHVRTLSRIENATLGMNLDRALALSTGLGTSVANLIVASRSDCFHVAADARPAPTPAQFADVIARRVRHLRISVGLMQSEVDLNRNFLSAVENAKGLNHRLYLYLSLARRLNIDVIDLLGLPGSTTLHITI